MVKKWKLQPEVFPLSYGTSLTRPVDIHHSWTGILELLSPQNQVLSTSLQPLWITAVPFWSLSSARWQHWLPFGGKLSTRAFLVHEYKFRGQTHGLCTLFIIFFLWAANLSLSAFAIPWQMGNRLLFPNASIQKNKVVNSVVNGNSNTIV